ncbi:MAG: phosphate acetyltransferase [Proteobacteria bacterium]|nr:phosphate acetyltransferase [Pseudomonadota bacterium]
MHFCQQLIQHARRCPCTVVLPEALDVRVLTAAARASTDGIAECILLGNSEAIRTVAAEANITLPTTLTIVQPQIEDYLEPLIALRAKKGKTLNAANARTMLANPATVAALFVADGSAQAMVAGAITASAEVLRPALQIIGLRNNSPLASSAFLMCFDAGMKVFADCALNINPNGEQLAAIAEQSAATASAFGLTPTIALLSYSSGDSGSGEAVEKVHAATELLKAQLPHLQVTGPIQYDAAVSPEIARVKLPNDPAAGNANVLIFPDLQAGNIAYKAVQQAAGIVSIGPLMQGLAATVNDLSRGASADDIYYTIAASVVQAAAMQD